MHRTAADESPPADLVELGRIMGAYGIHGWIKIRPHGRADESALLSVRTAWIRSAHGPTQGGPTQGGPTQGGPTQGGPTQGPSTLGKSTLRPRQVPDDHVAWRRVELLEARPHTDVLLVRIDSCESREQAAQLKGFAIAVSRSCFPESAPDEYYWVDLIGCEVIGGHGVVLGRVLAIDDFGAPHPVLRVGGPDREPLLIPFVAPIIGEVDIAAKRITADWAADY